MVYVKRQHRVLFHKAAGWIHNDGLKLYRPGTFSLSLFLSSYVSICLSCLASNLTAKFKGVSCFDSDIGDSGGTCLSHFSVSVSDGSWLSVHLADWHLWLVNPSLSLIFPSRTLHLRGNSRSTDRASGYYCHCDIELCLLVRLETSKLNGLHPLKFLFCTVKRYWLLSSNDGIFSDRMAVSSFISVQALCPPQ